MKNQVIQLAREAHAEHWMMTGDESEGDKRAARVTETWQAGVLALDPERFQVEYTIDGTLRERIDLVDLIDGVAYEMKVSPNNAHFEFYKDIFKVAVARDRSLESLRAFVFLVPQAATGRLIRGLAGAVISDRPLGLQVEIVGI